MATDYLDLAQQAFDASTTYFDANYRTDLDYSLRAFRNEHAAGSKYLSDEYKARSRLFRPKTRSIIRKNEAAAMQAAFSNRETINVDPGNPDDIMSVAAAAALKEVMEYRLSKTLPAFELYLGGVQDAQTSGAVCSYQYWEYQTKGGKKVKDRPCIELRPLENIRFDSGALWTDPINTSPYFCDIIPMYVCDVRAMMDNKDEKTGAPKWKKYKEDVILRATPKIIDSTRQARMGNKQDPEQESTGIKAFDIVWVMRWFMHDSQGNDEVFYTLGTEELLTDAAPIDEVYFHGVRPYVMGYAILETHKVIKTSLPVLTRPLQQETNQIANSRSDNVQFVLNKRWLVARGRQVDTQSLVRNVPGGVTLVTDPKNDVQESNWPDVTSSAYVEHDRLNSEFDDLAGNFSPSTKVANNAVNDTLGGSKMASQSAGIMTEYLLRTVNTTWWEKAMRQLALLEQYYETDEVILGVCANKAQLFPRFGLSRITDMLLMQEVSVSVNMAYGDPSQRLQKFLAATNAAVNLRLNAPEGANIEEMTKEIYSNAGYRDGARFFSNKKDPILEKAKQIIQQLQAALKSKMMELQASLEETKLKIASDQKIQFAKIQVDAARIKGDLELRGKELAVDPGQTQLGQIQLQLENTKLANLQLSAKVDQDAALMKLEQERVKLKELEAKADKTLLEAQTAFAEMECAKTESDSAKIANANIGNMTQIAQQIMRQMDDTVSRIGLIQSDLADTKTKLDDTKGTMNQHAILLGAGIREAMKPKKKPAGFVMKKGPDKRTKAVVVTYNDGTSEEMPVQ